MRRYRKKSKGRWLPLFGTPGVSDSAGGTDNVLWGLNGVITSPAKGNRVTTVITPLVPDTSGISEVSIANLDRTWSDELATQYGWMCKRIVGTLRIFIPQGSSTTAPRNILWGAGIFVAGEHPGAEEVPAGANADLSSTGLSAAQDETFLAYSPLASAATTNPWMWRKTWMVCNGLAAGENLGLFTTNNATPNLQDSDVVDVKSRRHIKPNTRLYLAQSIVQFPLDDTDFTGSYLCQWRADLRAFGSLTRPKQGASFR